MFSALFVQSPHSSSIFLLSARIMAIWQHLFSGAVIKPIGARLVLALGRTELGEVFFGVLFRHIAHFSLSRSHSSPHPPFLFLPFAVLTQFLKRRRKCTFSKNGTFVGIVPTPSLHCRGLKAFGFVGPGGDIARFLPSRGCVYDRQYVNRKL